MEKLPVIKLLPPDAREALVKASKIKDPFARQAAIEEATERARWRYPKYFKTEQEKKEDEHSG